MYSFHHFGQGHAHQVLQIEFHNLVDLVLMHPPVVVPSMVISPVVVPSVVRSSMTAALRVPVSACSSLSTTTALSSSIPVMHELKVVGSFLVEDVEDPVLLLLPGRVLDASSHTAQRT